MSVLSKRYLKRFVPPVVEDLFRGRSLRTSKPIWSGIYGHRRDVPSENSNYDFEGRVAEMARQAESMLKRLSEGGNPGGWHETLLLVAASVAGGSGPITIVDFGGGMGTGYLQLRAALPRTVAIDYHVVDLPAMTAAAVKVFDSVGEVHFHTSLEQAPMRPTILYVNSVLQYIDDYAAQLRALAARRAPRLLLARTAVGPFPTFASQQLNLPNQKLAYWFLNQDEVAGILADCGYQAVFQSLCDIEYDQGDFPPAYRIGRMRNILFSHE